MPISMSGAVRVSDPFRFGAAVSEVERNIGGASSATLLIRGGEDGKAEDEDEDEATWGDGGSG